MSLDAEMEWRRQRLQALVEHEDFANNKTALARALGYRDGAFVGQMLRGERPVSEKTVAQIEGLHGGTRYARWFSRDNAAPGAPAPHPWPFPRLSPEVWASLSPGDQALAEDAAINKLRELAAERQAASKRQVLAA